MGKVNKILVTGGLGLIGHRVVRKLLDHGHEVSVTDTRTDYGLIPRATLDYLIEQRLRLIPEVASRTHRVDVADTDGVDWLLGRYQPDVILHLASFPRQKVVNINPALGSKTMSQGLLTLCEAAAKHKISKFVYVSSSMVYGDFADQVQEDAVCRPQGQYGIMKLAGEWLVKDYSRRDCFDHVIIRPSAVYGELDVEDRVISKFLLTALRGGEISVNGPTETLDFTYVDDAADGIAAAIESDRAVNNTYNITKSHSKTLLAAAELAVRLAGSGTIRILARDPDFPTRGALNIAAARRDLGFDPKIDIDEGFEKYYHWLTTNENYRRFSTP